MKRTIALLTIAALALASGCLTIERAVERWVDRPVVERPVDPTPTPEQPTPELDNNRFLWKPVSESRGGRAAVLFPARLTVNRVTVNGEAPAEYRGRTNGNRPTVFLKHTGAHYGANVLVVAWNGAEEIGRWTVPNGATRHER